MKLRIKSTCPDESPPFMLEVEQPTALQCLAEIERQLDAFAGTVGTLTDDGAFDVSECLQCIADGKPYSRLCFSTPEDNCEVSEVGIV